MSLLENVFENFSTNFQKKKQFRVDEVYTAWSVSCKERSLLDKKSDRKLTVLTEEILDNAGARLETSPRKATKLLKLQQYKTMVVNALKETWSVASWWIIWSAFNVLFWWSHDFLTCRGEFSRVQEIEDLFTNFCFMMSTCRIIIHFFYVFPVNAAKYMYILSPHLTETMEGRICRFLTEFCNSCYGVWVWKHCGRWPHN